MKNGIASHWILGLLMLPGTALAGNWGEAWGTMVWGLPVSVPSIPGIGLIALALALSGTAAWLLRKRRTALGLPVLLVLLAVPLVVVAGTVSVPNTFVNGAVADADEVNDNFDVLESAVNAIDCATATDVVCSPSLSCPAAPACDTLGAYNAGFTAGGDAVDITTDNAALCTGAGGTYDAVADSCSLPLNYNCFVAGFCADAADLYPPDSYGYTNVYEGHQQGIEGLAGSCHQSPGSDAWQTAQTMVVPSNPLALAFLCSL